jgi:hypothetical protein
MILMKNGKLIFLLVFMWAFDATAQPIAVSTGMLPDSVTVAASNRYQASLLRKFFTGTNYRKEWKTPVRMPVFNLDRLGMVITKMGGGQQTRSLRLKDKDGREWALRTVDKFVEGALPKELRNTLAEKVVQDLVSASHPYAALAVGSLAESGGIIAARPTLYYVPDAEELGPYRKEMGNQVCLLELKDLDPGGKKPEDTRELIEKKLEEHETLVLQRQVLRARLLDMLIADWDRHEKQWSWAEIDSAGINYFYAIPEDRDQAFFKAGGIIPKIGKLVGARHINHFKKKSKNIRDLSYKAWNFDKLFLNDLDAHQWETVIAEMQRRWTDSAIDRAIKMLPPEIYALDAAAFTSKLKSRRDGLMKNALKYYRFLSARTTVAGTRENELFRISGSGKQLKVTVFSLDSAGNPGKKIYERMFLKSETSLVTLVGLNGADRFELEGPVHSRVRLRIYGDKGKDVFDVKACSRCKIMSNQD